MQHEIARAFAEKTLHGRFRKSNEAIEDKRSWVWLNIGYNKKETELSITASQDQELKTNWIKYAIQRSCVTKIQDLPFRR